MCYNSRDLTSAAMLSQEKRLATFTARSHASPLPKNLVAAESRYRLSNLPSFQSRKIGDMNPQLKYPTIPPPLRVEIRLAMVQPNIVARRSRTPSMVVLRRKDSWYLHYSIQILPISQCYGARVFLACLLRAPTWTHSSSIIRPILLFLLRLDNGPATLTSLASWIS